MQPLMQGGFHNPYFRLKSKSQDLGNYLSKKVKISILPRAKNFFVQKFVDSKFQIGEHSCSEKGKN